MTTNITATQHLQTGPALDADLLALLASYDDDNLREMVASSSLADAETLINLSRSKRVADRLNVARNHTAPVEALVTLSGDDRTAVRQAVAMNANTPTATLARLSTDPEFEVRDSVAVNPITPIEALLCLAQDADTNVAMTARDALLLRSKEDLLGVITTLVGDPKDYEDLPLEWLLEALIARPTN